MNGHLSNNLVVVNHLTVDLTFHRNLSNRVLLRLLLGFRKMMSLKKVEIFQVAALILRVAS